ELQVAGADLQGRGGAVPGHVEQLAGGLLHRGPAELETARAAGAAALGDEVSIAPLDGDLLDRDAQLVADQHRPHGDMTLAVRGGASQDGGGPVRVNLDGAVLVRAAGLAAGSGDLH